MRINKSHHADKRDWLLKSLFFIILLGIFYIVYLYQIKPITSTKLPEHTAIKLDKPPIELTSFQIRESGKLLTPQTITIHNDTVFFSCEGISWLKLFSSSLVDLDNFELRAPKEINLTSISIQDSLIIVADSIQGMLLFFDRNGYYQTSASWYPFREGKLKPIHICSIGDFLTVADIAHHRVGLISLIENKPFVEFMELLVEIPKLDRFELPYCSMIAPDGNIWIGDKGKAYIFTEKSQLIKELPEGKINKITQPTDFAIQGNESTSTNKIRIHMLDKICGKVFVYDLNGELTLIYPRDRILKQPSSIAINDKSRHIYISEQESDEITVFGF